MSESAQLMPIVYRGRWLSTLLTSEIAYIQSAFTDMLAYLVTLLINKEHLDDEPKEVFWSIC